MKTKAHTCGCGHGTCHTGNNRKTSLRLWFSFAVLISGIACQSLDTAFFRPSWVRLCWFFVGWLSVAIPIMNEELHDGILHGTGGERLFNDAQGHILRFDF